MARGVNKVILIGNLGDEPLCRSTHSGCSVTNISMVTNEVRRNIDTGESTEYAEWHRVVMWGKLADIAKQYLHKGSQIYVEGKLRTRTFLDKQGQKRSVTEIVADEMQMLGGRPPMQSNNMMNNQGQGSYHNGPNRGMGGQNPNYGNAGRNPMYSRMNQVQNGYGNMPSMGGMPPMQGGMSPYNNDNDMVGSGNIYGGNPMDNDMDGMNDDAMMSHVDDMHQQDDVAPPQVMKDVNGNTNTSKKQEPSLDNDELPF